MIVTVEEAKQKWCPKAQVAILDQDEDIHPGLTCNRYQIPGQFPAAACCIGDACMLWCWERDPRDAYGLPNPPKKRGYCGAVHQR